MPRRQYTPNRNPYMRRSVWTCILDMTERAIKVQNYYGVEVWLPLTHVTFDSPDDMYIGAEVRIKVPMWLFKDRRLCSSTRNVTRRRTIHT